MQSSPTIERQQKPYSFRDQYLLEQPLVPIAQPDHVYVALQLAQFFSQIIEHSFELLVIDFDRFGQKTKRGELFSMLVDADLFPQFSIAADFVGHGYNRISFRTRSLKRCKCLKMKALDER